MKFYSVILVFVSLLIENCQCSSQSFVNLNFESAEIPKGTSPGTVVPISEGLPGWSADFISTTETNQATQVAYDGISLGGNVISVIDTNASLYGFSPLQEKYSALLTGGSSATGQQYSAEISQTGMVPIGTQSLLLDCFLRGPTFTVILGGETINMTALQSFSNYTLYGGDISSSLAGEVEMLSFTEPPGSGGQPSFFELDNIQFSTSLVPEPGTLVLFAFGGLTFAWRCRKESAA